MPSLNPAYYLLPEEEVVVGADGFLIRAVLLLVVLADTKEAEAAETRVVIGLAAEEGAEVISEDLGQIPAWKGRKLPVMLPGKVVQAYPIPWVEVPV